MLDGWMDGWMDGRMGLRYKDTYTCCTGETVQSLSRRWYFVEGVPPFTLRACLFRPFAVLLLYRLDTAKKVLPRMELHAGSTAARDLGFRSCLGNSKGRPTLRSSQRLDHGIAFFQAYAENMRLDELLGPSQLGLWHFLLFGFFAERWRPRLSRFEPSFCVSRVFRWAVGSFHTKTKFCEVWASSFVASSDFSECLFRWMLQHVSRARMRKSACSPHRHFRLEFPC